MNKQDTEYMAMVQHGYEVDIDNWEQLEMYDHVPQIFKSIEDACDAVEAYVATFAKEEEPELHVVGWRIVSRKVTPWVMADQGEA